MVCYVAQFCCPAPMKLRVVLMSQYVPRICLSIHVFQHRRSVVNTIMFWMDSWYHKRYDFEGIDFAWHRAYLHLWSLLLCLARRANRRRAQCLWKWDTMPYWSMDQKTRFETSSTMSIFMIMTNVIFLFLNLCLKIQDAPGIEAPIAPNAPRLTGTIGHKQETQRIRWMGLCRSSVLLYSLPGHAKFALQLPHNHSVACNTMAIL